MKPIWNLLHPELQKNLKKQQSLQEKMHYHLPDEFRDKVHCHLSAGYLKIYAISSLWASKLRYQQQQILKSVSSDPSLNVQKIKIHVGVNPGSLYKTPEKTKLKISQTAKASLTESAASSNDPELKAVFLRLAALADRKE